MFNFVREKGNYSNKIEAEASDQNGNAAREEYERVLQMPSTANTARTHRQRTKPNISASSIRAKRSIPFDEKKFFAAASNNDVAILERMCLTPENINSVDQFGWTALMMAACEGHFDVVKFLVNRGANVTIADKQENTASSLASKKNHEEILRFLDEKADETICLSSDDDEACESKGTVDKIKRETFYCEDCKCQTIESDKKSHLTSTLHRLNDQNSHKFARHFGIPPSNVGFKMLVQQGWDRESGLGPEKCGQLYPVKTTLRKSRSGLGTRQPKTAKVTHFLPFDRSAIQSTYKPPPAEVIKTKRQLKAEKIRSQRKDRYLRKLLS